MKNLFARSNKWYPDPTQNPIRKLARRAYRQANVDKYEMAIRARIDTESDDARAKDSIMALFHNVIASCAFRASLQTAKPKPTNRVKRIRTEWKEAV